MTSKKFSLREYLRLVQQDGLSKAALYKGRFIPKKLYKFIALGDNCDLNAKKLSDLGNNYTRLSHYGDFNDPFEFQSIIIDKKRLKEKALYSDDNLAGTEKILSSVRDLNYVGCFSRTKDSLPMWAYYTNNHTGFCVEYRVQNALFLYKVLYEKERVVSATLLSFFLQHLFEAQAKNLSDTPVLDYYYEAIKLSFAVKHTSWRHEKEFRLIYPQSERKNGTAISNESLGIQPQKIYAGLKCRDEYIQKLGKIGEKLSCQIYMMTANDLTSKFRFQYKPLKN
jgi:hypothetical protein